MYNTDIILDNIEKLLIEKNIPKMQFYKDIGMSAGSFGDWRSGRSNPSKKTLIKLANYFNCSIDDLYKSTHKSNNTLKKEENTNNIICERILNIFKTLNNNYKKIAINEIFNLLKNNINIDKLEIIIKSLDDNIKDDILNILIDLSLQCSDEQIQKANENKKYIAALGGGTTELTDEDLANYIIENAIPNKPKVPDLKNL